MLLVLKPEGRRPLGRAIRRWEDNIIMIHLAQVKDKWLPIVKAVMNTRFTHNAENFLNN
jgi:hypothetical protein